MPLASAPTFKSVSDKMLDIPQPAIGGLNLKDLEFEQGVTQSPYMLNMMIKNGALRKRYGQELYSQQNAYVYDMCEYNGELYIHTGNNIVKGSTTLCSTIDERRGLFVPFNDRLYYFNRDTSENYKVWEYDSTATTPTWSEMDPYVPTVAINRKPDGSTYSSADAYNCLGTGFTNTFHGDGTSTVYTLTDSGLESTTPIAYVDGTQWTYDATLATTHSFKINLSTGKVTFSEAPPEGVNNVEITAYKDDSERRKKNKQIVRSKYYATFGGGNNSRLFVAGGGGSGYFYSDVFDATYFPYTNYGYLGNSEEDITGFGKQYNVLIVFKPNEIYSLSYYVASDSTTTSERQEGVGAFSSQIVNPVIGCDCPYTIQTINNQLTWFNSKRGVCTLVSSSIIDERNVRIISRNIENSNSLGMLGIMDIDLTSGSASLLGQPQGVDWDGKYLLSFPYRYVKSGSEYVKVTCGLVYCWDYTLTPFTVTSSKSTNPKDLAWFMFDCVYAHFFLKLGEELIYSGLSTVETGGSGKIYKFNDGFTDPDFDSTTLTDTQPINAYYMTPFLQFGAVEYLKTVKNLYVQCRGDTNSKIDIYYYTDEDSEPVQDSEPIVIGKPIWNAFHWYSFSWTRVYWGLSYRRKCSLKKIQMAAFLFKNNEKGRDLSITHLAMQYQIIKTIK